MPRKRDNDNPTAEETVESDTSAPNVAQYVEDVNEKGYIGESPDPNPNEAYTVEGVINGGPTQRVPDPNVTHSDPNSRTTVER